MSVIGIGKLPSKLTLPKIVRKLTWLIKGEFEALNCLSDGKAYKTCYIRLSEQLDPQLVIQILQEKGGYNAFLPERVPDLPPSKHGKIPMKLRRAVGVYKKQTPGQVFVWTNMSIIYELQSKFTGLYNLSRKTGHKLLDKLTTIVMERMKAIVESNRLNLESCFKLSSVYRRQHPHFGDFQLILSTLHQLQYEVNAPPADLNEADLTKINFEPYLVDQIPYKVIKASCEKFSTKIEKKIVSYIEDLDADTEPKETDSAEEIAQKRVHKELKKIQPYLPMIIKQVISNQFMPQKSPFHRVTMFGEPTVPPRPVLAPVLKKLNAVKIVRSDRTYNMIRFNIPCRQVTALQKHDGMVLDGNKLIIRSSDIPTYKFPPSLVKEMMSFVGEQNGDVAEFLKGPEVDDLDDDEEENELMDSPYFT